MEQPSYKSILSNQNLVQLC